MSRIKKRKNRRKNKIKKLLLVLSVFMGVYFCYFSVHGEDVFYAMKTFLYKDKASEIKIKVEKKDDLEDINLNFINEGSCDVYLRGFVFVYSTIEGDNGTTLSNSSVKINYSDEDCWFVGDDNYVYYTKPLKVGSITEKPMAESIKIDLSDDDKRMLGNGELSTDIVMEAVQVDNFAYKYEWDMGNIGFEELFNNKDENSEGNNVIKINIK